MELPEWSAQALRYQGSDGPVKVMYFQSRLEVTKDSFNQNSASPKERPELCELISFKASGASDTGAVFSGHLFDDPVEVLDSTSYKLQGEEYFENRKSALEDLASSFNNFPRVLPFDIESSYEPRLIKPSKEDDLLWYYFKAYATIAKDFKETQDFEADMPWKDRRGGRRDREEGEKKGQESIEMIKEEGNKKVGKKEGKEAEEKVEKKEIEEKKDNRKEEEEMERKRILQRRKELDGMLWRDGRRGFRCQCAFIFGITTKFNPSGMWIVEDIIYDEEERE